MGDLYLMGWIVDMAFLLSVQKILGKELLCRMPN
jgi:hypothetical protein